MILLLPILLLPATLGAEVVGRVMSIGAVAVEHARIRAEPGGETVFSDSRGRFRLAVEPPLELLVSHPRFKDASVAIESPSSGDGVLVVLEVKQEIYEEIAVTANRGEDAFAPVSVSVAVVEPRPAMSSLSGLVSEVVAVSENGQGGLFQTYSVRGVARGRVLTLLDGMRIVSERRAGVSASFVDATLIRSVDVLKGPSSTYYGSGALGGVVQLFPKEFARLAVETGFESQGSGDAHRYLALGRGTERWSLGLARRDADSTETPSGTELNSGFAQTSASGLLRWGREEREFRLTTIVSVGDDIGKSNTDFPLRTTIYPEEEHLLLRLALQTGGSTFDAWVHPQSLETRVTETGGGRSEVANDSLDFGASWQSQRSFGDELGARFGADYFARRSVDAAEEVRLADSTEILHSRTLDGAEEDELGLYGVLEWSLGDAVLLTGGRAAFQRQSNRGGGAVVGARGTTEDSAVTAFAGLVLPVAEGLELLANLGTGLRFPSLSERFFSGTTGRGEVEANADLAPEASLNADLGLRWFGERVFLTGFIFSNRIDDYIERIEIEPDVLTFRNLTSGRIEGVEIEGAIQGTGGWSFSFGGQAIEGRSDGDEPLADIPADAIFVGAEWSHGRWSWSNRWEHRFEKSDPGSGEKVIPGADLVSSDLSYEIHRGLSLNLGGRNLLDEEYFNSADRKVPPTAGRSLALGLVWELAD